MILDTSLKRGSYENIDKKVNSANDSGYITEEGLL